MSYFVTGFLFRFACASASSPSFRLTVLPDALYVPFILAITSESRFAYVILYNHITNKSGSEEQWLLTEACIQNNSQSTYSHTICIYQTPEASAPTETIGKLVSQLYGYRYEEKL